jgi:hypothetical protein
MAGLLPWLDLSQLPVPLRWASRPKDESSRDAEVIDLPSKMADFALISRSDSQGARRHYLANSEGPCGKLLDTFNDVGEYRIEVTAVAENATPCSAVVSYRKDAMYGVPRPQLSAAPPESERGGGGYFEVFGRLITADPSPTGSDEPPSAEGWQT